VEEIVVRRVGRGRRRKDEVEDKRLYALK